MPLEAGAGAIQLPGVARFIPPTIAPAPAPMGVLAGVRQVRRNGLGILPAIAYTQPIVSGNTGQSPTPAMHMTIRPEPGILLKVTPVARG